MSGKSGVIALQIGKDQPELNESPDAKKGAKNKLLIAKEFASVASAPLMTYNEASLEGLEPEKKHTAYGSKMKLILKLAIVVVIFIQVVLESFKKYGTEKIQVLSTNMHNEFYYHLSEYPLMNLLPLHWYLEMNKEDVVDRMECLINKNPEQCQHFDEMKCAVNDLKSDAYERCMLRTYRKFGKEEKTFCLNHFEKSGLYSSKDK